MVGREATAPLFLAEYLKKGWLHMKIVDRVRSFAEPVVEQNGCQLWDVEYVRAVSYTHLTLPTKA